MRNSCSTRAAGRGRVAARRVEVCAAGCGRPRTTCPTAAGPSPHDGPDARQQFLVRKGLCLIIVCACVERPYFQLLIFARAQDYDRHIGLLADLSAHLNAAQAGQDQIEQDQIVFAWGKQTQRIFARIRGCHGIAAGLQVHADKFLNRRIVVNDKDTIHLHLMLDGEVWCAGRA